MPAFPLAWFSSEPEPAPTPRPPARMGAVSRPGDVGIGPAMMLAAVHSSITGWDVVIALLAVLAAFILERVVPTLPWWAMLTLFAVVMFGLAATTRF